MSTGNTCPIARRDPSQTPRYPLVKFIITAIRIVMGTAMVTTDMSIRL